jgi:ABC-2 type transport system permease protein
MQRSLVIIVEIIRKEFYQIRRDRRMLMISLVAPILQLVLLGYAATTDIKYSNMVVCDLDHTAESRAFVRSFTTSGYFVHVASTDRLSSVNGFIEQGKASIALVLPVGFGRDLLARRPAEVQVLLDGADANTANILLGYASQIVTTFNQSILVSYAVVGGMGSIVRVVPEPRIWFNPDLRSSNFMVPGVLALVLMIVTTTLTAIALVKEKEIGTLEQLMVTPIRPFELILGKLIPFVVIGFLDVVVALAVARFWFGVPLLGSLGLLFALSGLFILTTLGAGLIISTISRSQQQAMLIAQFFFFMPFLFLGGFAFPISNMPKAIQVVTYIIPIRYYLEIVRAIFLKGSGLRELWPQALALVAIGSATLTMSVLRFRKQLE